MTARDPATAILAVCATQLGALRDISTRSVPWASATFDGTRIELAFTTDSICSVDAWLAGIGEVDIPVRRGFVADVAVVDVSSAADGVRVTLEALIVDTC